MLAYDREIKQRGFFSETLLTWLSMLAMVVSQQNERLILLLWGFQSNPIPVLKYWE